MSKATSMSFYSLLIKNVAGGEQEEWNPGDYSSWVGNRILKSLENAAEAVPESRVKEKEDFVYRESYIRRAVARMDEGQEFAWWDAPPEDLKGSRPANLAEELGSWNEMANTMNERTIRVSSFQPVDPPAYSRSGDSKFSLNT